MISDNVPADHLHENHNKVSQKNRVQEKYRIVKKMEYLQPEVVDLIDETEKYSIQNQCGQHHSNLFRKSVLYMNHHSYALLYHNDYVHGSHSIFLRVKQPALRSGNLRNNR